MIRVRWAALALGAGVALACGCSLCHRPLMQGCSTGMCVPECEGFEAGEPVTEGPRLEDDPAGPIMPGPGAPVMPAVPALPPASPMLPPVNPPGAMPSLVPQPTVPQLAAPPRLVPMPQSQPEAYRP